MDDNLFYKLKYLMDDNFFYDLKYLIVKKVQNLKTSNLKLVGRMRLIMSFGALVKIYKLQVLKEVLGWT